MHRTLARRLLCFVVLSLAPLTCAQSAGPVFPDPGNPSMSRDNQQALGMMVASRVYQQMPVLPDDSAETQYVRQLGKKLVATIPQQYSWPFEFHVVPQNDINAFALAGGQMFVNVGTIRYARNEAELAGVMAHEIAHVYMQHSAKMAAEAATKAQSESMLAGMASAMMGKEAGELVRHIEQMGIKMGAQGLLTTYSRNDESEADAVGAVILYKAGYNPQSMADFFKTVEGHAGEGSRELFSSHPNPGNRREAIQQKIANWPAENYLTSSPAFEAAHQHALAIKTYSGEQIQAGAKFGQWAALNQKSGVTFHPSGEASLVIAAANANAGPVQRQSVMPSRRMVADNLGPIRIYRPENWKVTMPKQPGQFITIAPDAGVTRRGVGYGVLLSGVAPPPDQRLSLDDMTDHVIKQMSLHTKLQQVADAQPTTVGGIRSRLVLLQSPSPFPDSNGQPQDERDWLVTVPQQNGTVVFMIFVAPEDDFPYFEPTFQSMLKSAQFH